MSDIQQISENTLLWFILAAIFNLLWLIIWLFQTMYLQLIIPQYFISNKSGIWSLSLIVHSKG